MTPTARTAVRLAAAVLATAAVVAGVCSLLRDVQAPEPPADGAHLFRVTEQERPALGPTPLPHRELAESASYRPVEAGPVRTVRVVVSSFTGASIAGADVRVEQLEAAAGTTDAAGELELELPVRPLLLSADAVGYAANSMKLEAVERTVQIALQRARPLAGRLELSNGRAPAERPSVVAYPLGMDPVHVRRAVQQGQLFAGPGPAVHVTRAEADGSFLLVGLCEGRHYGLAVFGAGLVSTAKEQRVTAGDSDVRVAVGYLFGAFVRAVDQFGQSVPLFEPTTYGSYGKFDQSSWLRDRRGARIWGHPMSVQLSGWPSSFDPRRGFGRAFLATAAEPLAALAAFEIDARLPGYLHRVAVIELPRVELETREKTIELRRVAPCFGTLRVRFSVADAAQIPEAKITLTDAAGEQTTKGLFASQMLPDLSFRIHNVPCGSFGFVFEPSNSRFVWPSLGKPHRIEIEADRETVVEVPLDDRGGVLVELQGSAREALEGLARGDNLLVVAPEKLNKGRDLTRGKIRTLMYLPMSGPTILIPGIPVGRYALIFASNGFKGLAWVDIEDGVTQRVQLGD